MPWPTDATILVTEGAVQSNHARITAAAAVIARVRSVLVLDARHGSEVAGNLLLDHLLGARGPHRSRQSGSIPTHGVDRRRAARGGQARPTCIPTGGSVPIGAAGYVAMVAELLAQLVTRRRGSEPALFPDRVTGTQAGLVVGVPERSRRRSPSTASPSSTRSTQLIADGVTLANGTAELLGDQPALQCRRYHDRWGVHWRRLRRTDRGGNRGHPPPGEDRRRLPRSGLLWARPWPP